MQFPILNPSQIPQFFPTLIWIILAAASIIFLSISAVLIYHWIHYNLNSKKMAFVVFAYGIVGIFLIITAATAAAYFQIIS